MKKGDFLKALGYYLEKGYKSTWVKVGLLLVVIAFLLWKFLDVTLDYIIPAMIGFVLTKFIIYLVASYQGEKEDKSKSNQDYNYLKEIYDLNSCKPLINQGKTIPLCFKEITDVKDKHISFELSKDEPEFKLDPLIVHHYQEIMKSHVMSYVENGHMVGLYDFDLSEGMVKFIYKKTNYFNHLVTNRAIDFHFSKRISLRTMFEYGPHLSPLSESKFSNHIGLLLNVVTSDDYVIVPKRRKDATYSKNKITSSVAKGFKVSDYHNITEELIKDDFKKDVIKKLELKDTDFKSSDIKFIGAVQSYYEGGKPQFFFSLKLALTAKDYFTRVGIIKYKKFEDGIDLNKRLYIIDIDTIRINPKNYKFKAKHLQKRRRRGTFKAELSFYMHLKYMD